MSRFQSHLFNWIEQSLPVELGRKARRIFNQITHNLADKLAQIIAENEAIAPTMAGQPTSKQLPSPVRALLRPAYALVKYLAGNSQVVVNSPSVHSESEHLSEREAMVIFGQVEAAVETSDPDSHNPDRTGSDPIESDSNNPDSKYAQQVNELIRKAIAYFRKKQRTLPAPTLPKAEQGAIVPHTSSEINYDLPYEEPIVSWLDNPELLNPPQNLTVVTGTGLPEVDILPEPEADYSMRAWLESRVLLVNHGDSWGVRLLLWLDRLVARFEQWLSNIWHSFLNWWHSKFPKI